MPECGEVRTGCTEYERLLKLAADARETFLSESKVLLLVYLVGLARRRKRGLWPTLAVVRNYVIFKVLYFLGLPQPNAPFNALAASHRVKAEQQAAGARAGSGGAAAGSSFLFDHSFSLSALR